MSNRDEVERLKWHKFPALDQGFVCLVDCMGDDEAICEAARVSYGKGTRRTSGDRDLIRYLMRHRHTTPFEMAEIKILVRVPMDCWRQWIRHRTANVNEYSTRYSEAIDATQATPPTGWRKQATGNKQGSSGFIPRYVHDLSPQDRDQIADGGKFSGQQLTEDEENFHRQARELYENRIYSGVAREQARKDLPLSTYTEAYWKCDLGNVLHFLGLRMDSHAQQEIREYATIIGEQIVAPLFPMTWEAFRDYRLRSITLNHPEICQLADMFRGMSPEERGEIADGLDCCMPIFIPNKRERDEFRAKLAYLGLIPES